MLGRKCGQNAPSNENSRALKLMEHRSKPTVPSPRRRLSGLRMACSGLLSPASSQLHPRVKNVLCSSPFTARLLPNKLSRAGCVNLLDIMIASGTTRELAHHRRGLGRGRVPPSSALFPGCPGIALPLPNQRLASGDAFGCCRVTCGAYLLAPATKLLSHGAHVFLTAGAPKTSMKYK